MSANVLARGARGGGIVIVGSALKALLQIASVTILSRLLLPDDFGVVAMVGVFVALGSLLRDFGMPTAALEAKHLSHQQASNLFWMNIGLAGGVAALLAIVTPLLVTLFSEPRLGGIVPVLAVVILIGGASAQLQVQLAREMKYLALVSADVASMLLGLICAVAIALGGGGYWALVAQAFVSTAALVLIRWVAARWRPTRFRRGHGNRRMLRVGAEYGSAQFLTFLQMNIDSMVIGLRLGAFYLGFYNRGYQILTSVNLLLDPLASVVIPTLHRARAEGRALEPLLLRIQFMVGLGVVWALAMAAGTSRALIPLVLGPGWEPTIPVFQLLAIGGSFAVFSTVNYWVFLLNELSQELLRYNFVTKPIVMVCIVVGSFFGITGVACGYAIGMAMSWPISLFWLTRTAGLPGREFFRNGVMVILACAAGGLVAQVVVAALSVNGLVVTLLAGSIAGTFVALGTLCLSSTARQQLAGSMSLMRTLLGRDG